MKAILSIKPEFVNKILSCEKKYEFRKKVFKQNIESVIIYSTKPAGVFIGEFKVNKIVSGDVDKVWSKTNKKAGITYKYYKEYFKNNSVAYALKIDDLWIYDHPIDPSSILPDFKAPQSFCYLRN
ncbi:ASCH domain-containing protein [Clostridium sp. 001]|uniref:ASCH domain-containing protein n=1 Tax=Clostridium sp. 001 TaxID=1970093 RepID=UPI001C2BCC74|nr:ASCH domain-containing protein [Clostridium sp. 001]QXE18285.1 hypothetical protein B5S50_05225 [Clostridium sp. 001]